MKDVLSTREAAVVLGVSEAQALTEYRGSAGRGRQVVRNTVKVGGKWYWPTEEVRAFLHRRQEEITKALHRLSVAAGTSWADEKVMASPSLDAVAPSVKWISAKPIVQDGDWRMCCFPEYSGRKTWCTAFGTSLSAFRRTCKGRRWFGWGLQRVNAGCGRFRRTGG